MIQLQPSIAFSQLFKDGRTQIAMEFEVFLEPITLPESPPFVDGDRFLSTSLREGSKMNVPTILI